MADPDSCALSLTPWANTEAPIDNSNTTVVDQKFSALFQGTAVHDQQQPAFYRKVPAEMRIKIFQYVFGDIPACDLGFTHHYQFHDGPSAVAYECSISKGMELLQVSRKTYDEALPLARSCPIEINTGSLDHWDSYLFFSIDKRYRHRLVKMTIWKRKCRELVDIARFDKSEYPNLKTIELKSKDDLLVNRLDFDDYFIHVANLLQASNGPAEYVGESLTTHARQDLDGHFPELLAVTQNTGIVVQIGFVVRIDVWEKLGGWPYMPTYWRKVHTSRHYLTVTWGRERVGIQNCPDLRNKYWYAEWAASPAWYMWRRDGPGNIVDETTRYVVNLSNSTIWPEELDLYNEYEDHSTIYERPPPEWHAASYDNSISRLLTTGSLKDGDEFDLENGCNDYALTHEEPGWFDESNDRTLDRFLIMEDREAEEEIEQWA